MESVSLSHCIYEWLFLLGSRDFQGGWGVDMGKWFTHYFSVPAMVTLSVLDIALTRDNSFYIVQYNRVWAFQFGAAKLH